MLTIIHVCCPGDKQQAALIFTARAIGITWVNLDTHLPSTVPECLLFGKRGDCGVDLTPHYRAVSDTFRKPLCGRLRQQKEKKKKKKTNEEKASEEGSRARLD